MKTIHMQTIPGPSGVRKGRPYAIDAKPGHQATIVVGESITLHGEHKKSEGIYALYNRTFRLGDTAEYDSFNLSYTGEIVSIGEKSITVRDGKKLHRLSIYEFDWRNFDLNLEAIEARNFEHLQTC